MKPALRSLAISTAMALTAFAAVAQIQNDAVTSDDTSQSGQPSADWIVQGKTI